MHDAIIDNQVGDGGFMPADVNDNIDDDFEMFEPLNGKFPLPRHCQADGLIKQDGDITSGSLPVSTFV